VEHERGRDGGGLSLSTAGALSPETHEATAADRAYAALVRAIATCELRPGAAFNERDQAAALSMSRTPLRQALQRLAVEGLIETLPQRGVYVTLIDPKEVLDNTVVREVLETEILRRMIDEGHEIDFGKLEELLATMSKAIKKKHTVAYLECDEEFHLTLAGMYGNRPALEAIRRSWIYVNRARYLQELSPKALSDSLDEHKAMVDGLRKRDSKATSAAVAAHMGFSRARLQELTELLPDAFVIGSKSTGPTVDLRSRPQVLLEVRP
jgi:GntR family transcriptional regulator, rspAB operon transcriptional repressor